MKKIIFFLLTLVLITTVSPCIKTGYSQSQYDDLRVYIQNKLIMEYNLARTLDEVGVDVSTYSNTLNLCLSLLEKASNYNVDGDAEDSIKTLELTTSILDHVDGDLKKALTGYYSKGYINSVSKFMTPIIATIIIAVFAIIFWVVYKNYYNIKILKMRPEVNQSEV